MTAALADTTIPRLARGVRLHHDTARDAWVLLAPERVLQPDSIAIEILKRVDGNASLSAIVDSLLKDFSAPRDRVEPDVHAFIAGLVEKGLLEVSS